MSNVRVFADQNGNVIHVSENNPEYGWIFVEQEATQMEGGWLKRNTRKARIMGKVVDLQEQNFIEGMELPGKIVVQESFTPFNSANPDINLKIAGNTGVICRVDDRPIYRQTLYTSNLNAFDELIMHTNTDEIKDVLAAQKEISVLKNRPKENVINL
jgi:hypothetical protein